MASNGHWRWLFCEFLVQFIRSYTSPILHYFKFKDMNIPLAGLAATIVFCFLRTKRPHGRWLEKVTKIDWMYVCIFPSYKKCLIPISDSVASGNLIVITATGSIILALTWGGIQYPWSSYRVLVPLLLGLAGIIGFIVYETRVPKCPTVPLRLLSNRTSVSG